MNFSIKENHSSFTYAIWSMGSQITKFSSSITEVKPSDTNKKNVSLIFSNREILAGIQLDCLRKDTKELIGMSCHVIHDTQTNILQIFSKGDKTVNYNDTIYNTVRARAANFGAFEISELLKKIAKENDPTLITKLKALPPVIAYYYCENHTPPFSTSERRFIEVSSSLSHIWEAKKDDYSFRKTIQYILEFVSVETSLDPEEARVADAHERLTDDLETMDVIKKIDAIRRHVFGKIKPEIISTPKERETVQKRRDDYIKSPRIGDDEYTIMRIILPMLREFYEVINGKIPS